MQLRIISIGKSKGIRLPASVFKKYRIEYWLELIMEKDHFILKPKTNPRKNWADIFWNAEKVGESLIMPDIFKDEDL